MARAQDCIVQSGWELHQNLAGWEDASRLVCTRIACSVAALLEQFLILNRNVLEELCYFKSLTYFRMTSLNRLVNQLAKYSLPQFADNLKFWLREV